MEKFVVLKIIFLNILLESQHCSIMKSYTSSFIDNVNFSIWKLKNQQVLFKLTIRQFLRSKVINFFKSLVKTNVKVLIQNNAPCICFTQYYDMLSIFFKSKQKYLANFKSNDKDQNLCIDVEWAKKKDNLFFF